MLEPVCGSPRRATPHRVRFESRLPPGTTLVWHDKPHDDAVAADIPDAEVFVGTKLPAPVAKLARNLRLVHVSGAGTDGIAFDALPADALVANTFNHEQSIAEYVVATSILLRRRFLDQDRRLRTGVWATSVYDDALSQPDALGAAHVGFVGFGHIGRQCWNLLRQFGCTASAVTGRGVVDESAGLRWAGRTDHLGELMAESHVVVVSAPLSNRADRRHGSVKLAQRIPIPAADHLRAGRTPRHLALTVAAYLCCIAPPHEFDPGPQASAMADPARERLAGLAGRSASTRDFVRAVLAPGVLFQGDLASSDDFVCATTRFVETIVAHGPHAAAAEAMN